MNLNARLYFVERAYCVWGATISSCTVGKEIPYISYRIYYLKKMTDPFTLSPFIVIELQRRGLYLNTSIFIKYLISVPLKILWFINIYLKFLRVLNKLFDA